MNPVNDQVENLCDQYQQSIACHSIINKTLADHVRQCTDCQKFTKSMQLLDTFLDVAVRENSAPDHFTDLVMNAVIAESKRETTSWLGGLITSKFIENGLLSLGIVMSIIHLVRFFLGLFFTSMVAAA